MGHGVAGCFKCCWQCLSIVAYGVACGSWCDCLSLLMLLHAAIGASVQLLWQTRLQQVPTGQPEPDTDCPTVLGLLGLAYLTANAICNMASGPMRRKTTLRGTRFQGISVGRTIAEAQTQ